MSQSAWWERPDLRYIEGRLFFGNHDLEALARSAGAPLFAYYGPRIKQSLEQVHAALNDQVIRHEIFYAMKANRFLPLMTYLKTLDLCGVDITSPGELDVARQAGFLPNQISYTGTMVADEDLEVVARNPQVRFNCDSISVIRRLGQRMPGREIGIRINPQIGLGYKQTLLYAGNHSTKFGIYQDRYEEALETAARYDLKVKTLHFHGGSGFLSPALKYLGRILERCEWFLERTPGVETLNCGGGLGRPQRPGDEPLDLGRWSKILADFLLPRGLKLNLELGDYLVKDAGVLLLQVNTVENKDSLRLVGVNGGMNLQNLWAYYQIFMQPVPLRHNPQAALERVTIAGNINEPVDLFAEACELPAVEEGDYLALLNTGGYGSSVASNHSMRGKFGEYLLLD